MSHVSEPVCSLALPGHLAEVLTPRNSFFCVYGDDLYSEQSKCLETTGSKGWEWNTSEHQRILRVMLMASPSGRHQTGGPLDCSLYIQLECCQVSQQTLLLMLRWT